LQIITGRAASIYPVYAATAIRAGALITSLPSWISLAIKTAGGFQTPAGSANSRDSAVVVVEGATPENPVTGAITMVIVGILLNVVGLGVLCWALFTLAVHALPFFVGLTAGIYSFQIGMVPFGAIAIGFIVACCSLAVGRYAFSVARAPIVRILIGLVFAVPAARAGYDVTLALAHIGIPSEWWQESFAMFGAIAVGSTAWARVSMQTDPALGPGVALGPNQSPNGATTASG
jgi:hypothetical protein